MKLGSMVRDSVTGNAGMVTARAQYLYNEPQVLVEGRDSVGRAWSLWLEVSRVRVVKRTKR